MTRPGGPCLNLRPPLAPRSEPVPALGPGQGLVSRDADHPIVLLRGLGEVAPGVVGDVAGAGGGHRALESWSMDWFHERAIFKTFQELARRLAGGKAS